MRVFGSKARAGDIQDYCGVRCSEAVGASLGFRWGFLLLLNLLPPVKISLLSIEFRGLSRYVLLIQEVHGKRRCRTAPRPAVISAQTLSLARLTSQRLSSVAQGLPPAAPTKVERFKYLHEHATSNLLRSKRKDVVMMPGFRGNKGDFENTVANFEKRDYERNSQGCFWTTSV